MSETALIHTFLTAHYHRAPQTIKMLFTTPVKHVAHVTDTTGAQWIFKVRHHELTPIGPPFNLADWLHARAALLEHLAICGYSAPRLARTYAGQLVGVHAGWLGLLCTYIPGSVHNLTPTAAFRAAQQLATLHQRTTASNTFAQNYNVWSWWQPTQSLLTLQAGLAASSDRVPSDWKAFHLIVYTALQRIKQWPALPESIIHADCWAGNIVMVPPKNAVFIDWDTGGWGPSMLDFADFVIGCHFTLHDPYRADIRINTHRIAAVTNGYTSQRPLQSSEIAILEDAIRYGAIFRGARTFARLSQEDWSLAIEQELRRQYTRYTISARIAEHVRQHLGKAE